MGTEVLLPHDILGTRRLGFGPSPAETAADSSFPRRKLPPNCGPGANPRFRRRPEPRNRREGFPMPPAAASAVARSGSGGSGNVGRLVMGQVTILRRGESLDSVTGRGRSTKLEKERKRGEEGAVLSSVAGGDLIVFGTGSVGLEPAAVPKQTRLVGVRTAAKPEAAEVYAGPAFSLSPSPRALPLPTFPSRKPGGGGRLPSAATRDLRRILRLD